MSPSSVPTSESASRSARPFCVPELLAPVGHPEALAAAIENGADAVYFGLDVGFNARARAQNFPLDRLSEVMRTLHLAGVKGYVTLNTLAFTSELAELETVIRAVAAAGVDAVLVQDVGVARLIRAVCPELTLHASTQMSLTCAPAMEQARSLGIRRVVLPRELAIDEIRLLARQTDLELETFVHGALCVAYSGQCLTSESLGGRSANRGQCAQACRLPYDLIADGKQIDLGDQKYLLSPQDLAAYALLPDLIEAGVGSFKIEGRLKTPEYVANLTHHYREAIDQAVREHQVQLTPQSIEEMELSFSRGFSPGWLQGCDHKMLVPGLSSAKRGILLGKITAIHAESLTVRLERRVQRGDGIVFAADRISGSEQGGRVYELFRSRKPVEAAEQGEVEVALAHGSIDFGRLKIGQEVWKTDDPQLTRRLRKSFTSSEQRRRLPLDLEVFAEVGAPLKVLAYVERQLRLTLTTPEPLAVANKHPATAELFETQLGRLGQSPFVLQSLTADIQGTPMVPLSVLGQLRRELVDQLTEIIATPGVRALAPPGALARLRAELPAERPVSGDPQLKLLCRTRVQLETALALGLKQLRADFADIREYREAVTAARSYGAELLIAPPRIQKPEEAGLLVALAKYQPDGLLVRNLAGIRFCQESQVPFVVDYALNATNKLTVDWLRQQGPLAITPSYDLNRDQLIDLCRAVPPHLLEVVIHQHMPMFHMEHCVFCAVLSPGTNKHNCGRPCDHHEVKLRDRVGMEHPLTADVGCRNTLFNAQPQSAAEVVPDLLEIGVRHFRVELLEQTTQAEIQRLVSLYQQLLQQELLPQQVWQTLKAANRVGVTRGTLEASRDPLAIL